MNEKQVEAAFCRFANSLGCWPLKLKLNGLRGFPDRSILMPNGKIIFIEFKSPTGKGKVSPQQKAVLKKISDLKFPAYVIDDLEIAKQILMEHLNNDPMDTA